MHVPEPDLQGFINVLARLQVGMISANLSWIAPLKLKLPAFALMIARADKNIWLVGNLSS